MHGSMGGERKPGVSRPRRATPGASRLPDQTPELRSVRGTNAATVIKRLNPIIRGWAVYHRTQVSSTTFSALDGYLWKLT